MAKKPSIIDRYIAGQVAAGAIMVGMVLLGIAWLSQIIRLISYLVNNNLAFWSFLKMTSLLFPELVVIIMPIAVFVVILFIYNRLIGDKELVIMEAAGCEPKRLARPGLFIALCATAMAYAFTLWIGPSSARHYRDMIYSSKNDLSAMLIKEGEFNQLSPDITIYVKSAFKNIMTEIFVNDKRGGRERTIIAQKGIIRPSERSAVLTLENGSIQETANGKTTFGTFDHYTADMELGGQASERGHYVDELYLPDLLFAKERGFAQTEVRYSKMLAEAHNRILAPLNNLLFALIALCATLSSPLSQRSSSKHNIIAAAAMIGAQTAFVSAYNLMTNHRLAFIAVYIIYFGAIAILFRILGRERRAK